MNLNDLLECAVEAARAAANHAMENSDRRAKSTASFQHDVKLELDVECQIKATAVIHARFPMHAISGEEDSKDSRQAKTSCEFEWIIDPIDGTVNFSHGLPVWCSSVAVREHGDVLAGAICAPELDELYTATADAPALRNGTVIHVSAVQSLSAAMIFTGLDKKMSPGSRPFILFERIAANVQRPRIVGSAALDLCNVARGSGDGYFETGIYTWDAAAGGLIVRQAGGKAEILQEHENNQIHFLATNGRIHADLKSLVTDPIP